MSLKLWIFVIIGLIIAAVIGLKIFQKLPDQVISLLIFLAVIVAVAFGLIMLFRKMSEVSSWN